MSSRVSLKINMHMSATLRRIDAHNDIDELLISHRIGDQLQHSIARQHNYTASIGRTLFVGCD